jgi:hypothetical protein
MSKGITERNNGGQAKKAYGDYPIWWKILRPVVKTVAWLSFSVALLGVSGSKFDFLGQEGQGLAALIVFILWAAYTILLIILYYRGIARNEAIRQQGMADMLNSFIGQNIDSVLAVMPPPTKSVKHRGSKYISYYWIKTRRQMSGTSIPLARGIRIYSGGSSSSRQTLTILVDPETSSVASWNQGED